MPRTREHADLYADALTTLAAATHRPANVVNTGSGYAIRVDFEYNRYLLATNTLDGLSADVAAVDRWIVSFFQASDQGGNQVLVTVEHQWLVDAFDLALVELGRTGNRIEADLELGELNSPGDI